MHYSGMREPPLRNGIHPVPVHSVPLAATPKRLLPMANDLRSEASEHVDVGRHGVVREVASRDLCNGYSRRLATSRCDLVIVVQSAEQWNRGDARPHISNAFTWNRNPLTNSLVRSHPVEIVKCIFSKYVPEMRLPEDNQMIEAFAPDAPDEPFAHRIHQWRPHSRSKNANPSAFGSPIERRPPAGSG